MALSEDEELELLQLQKEKHLRYGGETVKGITELKRRSPMQRLGEERKQEQAQDQKWSKKFDTQTRELGGKATDAATRMGLPPEIAGGVGALTYAGARIAPDIISGGIGGGLGASAKVPLSGISKSLMASALKVPSHIGPTIKKTDALVQTMLQEGINVSKGGVDKLRGMIGGIQDHIDDIILNSNKSINKARAASELRGVFDKFKFDVLDGRKSITTIAKSWQDFADHPLIKGKMDIPIQQAQEMKKQTYRALESAGAYERQTQAPARLESKQAIARGLRKEIAAAEPAVGDWNAQESKLIAALEPTERRVLQEMRNNPVGLSLLAHSPEAMMGFVGDRSSKFKSILANMLYNRGGNTGRNVGAGSGVSLFEIGKFHNEDNMWDQRK